MKSHILHRILASAAVLFFAAGSYAEVIGRDDFETGTASRLWTGFEYASVADLQETGRSGKGLKFTFIGNSSSTVDATSEARFDLGAIYTDISIEYDLFIPTNYSHVVPSDRADNNKFFRLWQKTYGDITTGNQLGASMLANSGGSVLGTDYQMFPGWGTSTAIVQYKSFITSADLGKWHTIKIWVKSGASLGDYGFIKIYKNGNLIIEDKGLPVINKLTQGWRYGYILGWSNSGFRQTTNLYVDNVVMSVNASLNPPKAPTSPSITK